METATEPSVVEEVAPGIHRIALPLPGLPDGVNVHLVRGDGPTTLVDSAMPLPGALGTLESGLAAAGSSLAAIDQILLTHHHLDHTGLAAGIHRRTGAAIVGVEPVARAVADPSGLLAGEIAWGERHVARHDAPGGLLDAAREGVALVESLPVARSTEVLDEGDAVRAGDLDLTVRRRPGHSPTDTLFVADVQGERPVAFVGDHVFRAAPLTPVLGSMLGADDRPAARYLEALEETASIPGLLALTGHGPALPDVRALVTDRRGALDRRTGRVRDALNREPRPTWEIGVEVWRGVPSVRHGLTRLAALLASLELLEDAGDAEAVELTGGRVGWRRVGGG